MREQIAWFKRLEPDVICLQEVTPAYLATLLQDEWIQSRFAFNTMDVGQYGTLILTRCVRPICGCVQLSDQRPAQLSAALGVTLPSANRNGA